MNLEDYRHPLDKNTSKETRTPERVEVGRPGQGSPHQGLDQVSYISQGVHMDTAAPPGS